jgi:hypothetical protein
MSQNRDSATRQRDEKNLWAYLIEKRALIGHSGTPSKIYFQARLFQFNITPQKYHKNGTEKNEEAHSSWCQ